MSDGQLTRWHYTRWLERKYAPKQENVIWFLLLKHTTHGRLRDSICFAWIAACVAAACLTPYEFWLVLCMIGLCLLTWYCMPAVRLRSKILRAGLACDLLSAPVTQQEFFIALQCFRRMAMRATGMPLALAVGIYACRWMFYNPEEAISCSALALTLLYALFWAPYWILVFRPAAKFLVIFVALPVVCVLLHALTFGVSFRPGELKAMMELISFCSPVVLIIAGFLASNACQLGYRERLRRIAFEAGRRR